MLILYVIKSVLVKLSKFTNVAILSAKYNRMIPAVKNEQSPPGTVENFAFLLKVRPIGDAYISYDFMNSYKGVFPSSPRTLKPYL